MTDTVPFNQFTVGSGANSIVLECDFAGCDWYRRGDAPVNLHALLDAAKHHVNERHS